MGYFDSSGGGIKEELLDRKAKELAESFIKKPDVLSSAQMRRFFGEFRQLEKKVNAMGFQKVKPLIKMIKSKASYAANRPSNKIPESFKNFLIANVDSINEKPDFDAFMLHFEAVVGFYYGLPGVRNN
jgi:CRISPR-associated protein Csm2